MQALLLGLVLIRRQAPVLAAVSFADQGVLGLPAVRYGSVVWRDYDNGGRLDVLVAGCIDGTRTARTARGSFRTEREAVRGGTSEGLSTRDGSGRRR